MALYLRSVSGDKYSVSQRTSSAMFHIAPGDFKSKPVGFLADPNGRNEMILTSIHVDDLSVNIGPCLTAEVKDDTANIGFPSHAASRNLPP